MPSTVQRPAGRLLPLDGIRGLAVLAVFFYHYGGGGHTQWRPLQIIGGFVGCGWMGVSLFFVLSGFLITGILWDIREDRQWWKTFYTRRASRILPLYYLSLFLVVLAAWDSGRIQPALSRIWSSALFLQDVPGVFSANIANTASPIPLLHFWSLAVEEQFYLLWPFLLLRCKTIRQAIKLCIGVFAVSLLFRIVMWGFLHADEAWSVFVLVRMGELAIGGALGLVYRAYYWQSLKLPAAWALGVGAVGYCAVSAIVHSTKDSGVLQHVFGITFVTLGLAGFLVLSLQSRTVSRWMSNSVLRWFGKLSYGIYVFHVLLAPYYGNVAVAVTHSDSGSLYNFVRLIAALVGSIIVAWLSLTFFENPIRYGIRLRSSLITELGLAAYKA